MRFIIAIVFFVVAVVGVGLGVAQRTVLAPPESVTSTVQLDSAATVTVIDGSALNAYEGRQTLAIRGGVVAPPDTAAEPDAEGGADAEDGEEQIAQTDRVVAAYGRTGDVLAWVGDTRYTLVTFDEELGELVAQPVSGSEESVPDPYGSDLWYDDFTGEGELGITVNVPRDVSVLLASDGELPAPQEFSVTWPLDSSTPYSTWLILGGVGSLILGLIALLWALLHMRRQRGPRRKSAKAQKMPKVPRPSRYRPLSGRPTLGRPKGRRSASRIALVPGLLITGLVLSACTPGASIVATPSPTPTEEPVTPAVAASERQIDRIVSRIGETVALADEETDEGLAATRLAGPALQFREAAYAVREEDSELGSLVSIPSRNVELALPQRLPDEGATWPRAIFAVVEDPTDETRPPQALLMIQDDPRSPYRVHYALTLEPQAVVPPLAPVGLGSPLLPADTPQLAVTPAEVAASYSQLLLRGEEAENFDLFEAEGDSLRTQIGLEAKRERRSALPDTASIEFTNRVVEDADILSFVTNDGGAIMTAYLTETETVTPTQSGAAVNSSGAVEALSGSAQSTRGIIATYGLQILFFVPPLDSTEPVRVLGYTQGLVSAREVP
ncbi:MAG: hypothetical protein KJ659_02645 [Actinobacteria bacterium]|nr:hypothetical protein [Actinomycetota bacterium]MBU1609142.1 hypothetical protein [Actinomycetota bacterium]MBU2314728.1 hypothetical protein [Actinomycetota bacterium]MBU2384385.1 hypothetical protein [Actinomycetota bacterium]